MIIFYNKKTKEIFAKIDGRVHDKGFIESAMIKPGNVDKNDIGKFVVPFKTIYREVEELVTELRITNPKTLRVEEVIVGKRMVKKPTGMVPDVRFPEVIYKLERGEKKTRDYKVKLDKNGEVIDFIQK